MVIEGIPSGHTLCAVLCLIGMTNGCCSSFHKDLECSVLLNWHSFLPVSKRSTYVHTKPYAYGYVLARQIDGLTFFLCAFLVM